VVSVWGKPIVVDGTRPVLLGGGLLAALVGVIAYRQMDSRRDRPIMADLRNAIRRRTRNTAGLLIAVEGTFATNTSDQAERLAGWLRTGGGRVEYVRDPVRHDAELTELITGSWFTGLRSRALFATAVRADLVERTVLPVLDDGGIVVMERFIDSPLAHFSTVAELDFTELDELAEWATGGLRPDVTLVLEANDDTARHDANSPDPRWQVQHLLNELAAADPDRYLVVEADGTDEEIAERVRQGLQAVPAAQRSGLLPANEVT
jgi:dTMP kinase